MRQTALKDWRWRGRIVLATLTACLLLGVALGQNPNVQDEFFSGRLRQQGDSLVFCTWEWSATREFDAALALQVSDVLLLDVRVHEVEQHAELTGEEMLQWIWVLLSDECDLAMGFNLTSDIYPSWLTPSRAYLDAPYVAVVTDPEYESLADVPAGRLIGSQLYTQLDNLLVVNLASMGADAWRRLPYDDTGMLVDHVAAGVLEAGIMWGPRFSRMQLEGRIPEQVRAVPIPGALGSVTEQVGAVTFSRNSWIVSEFDAAIVAMIQGGQLAALIAEHALHATVPAGR